MDGFAAASVRLLPVIAPRVSSVLENNCHLSVSQSPDPNVPWPWVPKYFEYDTL